MHTFRMILISMISAVVLGCGSQPETRPTAENKELAREFFRDIDDAGASIEFIDKWMTPDFKSQFNNQAMDLAAYRQFMSGALSGFSELRHEIHHVLAEDDLVATVMTLHMVHSGEFLGFPPTGHQVTIEELAVLRIADGKIAEEWVAFDFASLQQQIQPAPPQQ